MNDDNVLLHINFLLTGNGKIPQNSKERMMNEFSGEYGSLPPKAFFVYDGNEHIKSLEQNKEIVNKYKEFLNNLNATTAYNLLFNRSAVFYKDKILTTYNKSTYYFEANGLIINSTNNVKPDAYVYNIGSGKDLDKSSEYKALASLVVNNLSSEICYDLTLGIRLHNQWTNIETPSKIHVYTSNTTPQSGSHFLPQNKTTACVDPKGINSFGTEPDNALTLVFKKNEDSIDICPQTQKIFIYGRNSYNITTVNDIHL